MHQTYSQAKVKEEEDVEGHVDLQREVFVEVLAGFYWTGEKREIKSDLTNTDEPILSSSCHGHTQKRKQQEPQQWIRQTV